MFLALSYVTYRKTYDYFRINYPATECKDVHLKADKVVFQLVKNFPSVENTNFHHRVNGSPSLDPTQSKISLNPFLKYQRLLPQIFLQFFLKFCVNRSCVLHVLSISRELTQKS